MRSRFEIPMNRPDLSLIPSFTLPDLLCDPTDLIWRQRTPFEAITGRTVPSQPLAEVFLGFSSAVWQMPGNLCTAPRIISLSPLSLATDVTDATLGASGLWLGTRTGAGGTATQVWNFFGRSPHGSMDNRRSPCCSYVWQLHVPCSKISSHKNCYFYYFYSWR